MLNFFPTPYPDEWWYSVLCRYHMRTGNRNHATTIHDLFNDRQHAAMGAFFPNRTIFDVMQLLPEGLFDIKEIMLEHTLFPYFFRARPLEQKEEMLEHLCIGKATTPTNLWKTARRLLPALKYCPVCRKEDIDKYGEPYWHTTHQVPNMTACPEHGCHLLEYVCTRRTQMNESFIIASEVSSETEPDYDLKEYEEFLAHTLRAYLKMPLSVGPTEGHNNLAQALSNMGYGMIKSKFNITLDSKRLYNDLRACFGDELIRNCFGEESSAVMIAKICNWNLTLSERYALLATMIRQKPDVTFGKEPIADNTEQKLRELMSHHQLYAKKYVASQLGIKTYQLDIVAHKYGIKPFWVGRDKNMYTGIEAKSVFIKAYYTDEEKEEIEEYAQDKNFSNTADFLRYCIAEIMSRDEPKSPERSAKSGTAADKK